MPKNWTFLRFTRESWKYMQGESRLYFLRRLIPAWVKFNHLQKADATH